MSVSAAAADTTEAMLKAPLDTPELLAMHLTALVKLDPRLAPVWIRAGQVELRTTQKGFAGMAKVICGQQLSTASARAIWTRLIALEGASEAQTYLLIEEAALRKAGLSVAKVHSIRAVAEAVVAGTLDFTAVETLSAEAAIAQLTAVKGVGPWTAEIYLLFCVGHPDIFPAGDLALKKAVADGLKLNAIPKTGELIEIASAWSPHRGAAALLFWRYFHALRDREGILA
ncbi:MAG TPA: DNA-3-methyladenine glycosylase 2 family protein [Devosiaceae bacterium]|nr:DNA-3-methyladenine glycosylase 2 family protein [Devosiaceae bacterium]